MQTRPCRVTKDKSLLSRARHGTISYKQIGFETNARDVLRMKTDGKWLEHGFDAVTFSRDDVLSGLPAPGATAEQGAGPSPSFKRRGRKGNYDCTPGGNCFTRGAQRSGATSTLANGQLELPGMRRKAGY